MAISRGDIKAFVLEQLQKSSTYQGFYTDTKINNAIQEAVDFVATLMMPAGGGFLKSVEYITTVAGTASYSLPTECAVVDVVRYKSGDTYIPVEYSDDYMTPQVSSTAATQFPNKYKIIGATIVFNPLPTDVGTNYLQLEVLKYPTRFTADGDTLPGEFDRACGWYLKYRACTILITSNGGTPTWSGQELEWRERLETMIAKRIKKPRYVKEFME